MSDDLVAFLRARLADDEGWVKARTELGGSHWAWLDARVLREVEAKRAILDAHEKAVEFAQSHDRTITPNAVQVADAQAAALYVAIRFLAAVYREVT